MTVTNDVYSHCKLLLAVTHKTGYTVYTISLDGLCALQEMPNLFHMNETTVNKVRKYERPLKCCLEADTMASL